MSDAPVPTSAAAPTPIAAAPAAVTPAAKPAATSPVSTTKPASIVADAGKDSAADASKSIVDGAKAESPEEKAAREVVETENKRLLAADDKTLSAEDLTKKQALVQKQADDAKAAAAKAVPEKYDIKAPEGMTLDTVALEKFTPIAKELGLSNDQVQKLADFQAEQTKAALQAQADNFNKFLEDTKAETKTFFGTKLSGELKFVAKARDMFIDKDAMELLETTGLANHKAIITMLSKIGRAVSEDKLVDGKSSVGEQRSDAQIIYAKDKPA